MPLTRGELRVLELAADGAAVSEIARKLDLAVGTVRNSMAAAVRKTVARSRVDAIRISRKEGWI
ncbi:helix-turn-helix transcriptional regulator [Streptomyces sp. I6]|uniref:response regulator transcription factor n=1 Tax=Streptomyces sp. I6 TaxID=2483113 RepID=UPI00287FF618|nr:helix-turn-helix transcriptional regulator [Streptomyces sp. I6]